MRIVCDSCGAKYSISDDKVRGKTFKVRCKKCSNLIVVESQPEPEVDDATRVVDVSAGGPPVDEGPVDAVWYVVVDGAQTGPLTVQEIGAQSAAGAVDADTYCWREGMDDWLRIGDVADFDHLFESEQGAAAADAAGEFDDEATRVVASGADEAASGGFSFGASFGSGRSANAFPSGGFSVANEAAAAAEQAAEKAAPASGGFFSAAAASAAPAASEPEPAAPAAAGQASGMVGQRNENSVLFSLSSLTSMKSEESSSDVPTTEGSGLIDIRALASANSAVNAGGGGGGDDLAAAPMVAPAVIPLATKKSNTLLYVSIVVGLLVVAGLGFVIVKLVTAEDPAPTVVQVPAESSETTTDEPDQPTEVAEATPEQPTEQPVVPTPVPTPEGSGDAAAAGTEQGGALPADAVAQNDANTGNNAGSDDSPRDEPEDDSSTRREERTADAQPSRAEPEDEPEEEERTERAERGERSVGNALDRIRGGGDEEEEEEPEEAVPESLSRRDVQRTIRRYSSRINRCKENDSDAGRYPVSFVIQSSGRVTNVDPEDSGDVASCIARVVRGMRFPEFSGDNIPVTYPFNLE